MAPKKKRAAKPSAAAVRATRSKGKTVPKQTTGAEKPELKCPKKFGKFRCLVEPEIAMDLDETSEESRQGARDDEAELTNKLTNLDVGDAEEETAEVQAIVVHVEDEDVVLECISEDVIPIAGEQEDIILVKDDGETSNDYIQECSAQEEVPQRTQDIDEATQDVIEALQDAVEASMETEHIEEKVAELIPIEESVEEKLSEAKKAASEKLLIPSRKSTRIFLKKSKSLDRQDVVKAAETEKKPKSKPRMKNLDAPDTETETTTSSEDSDEKKSSSEEGKEGKDIDKGIKAKKVPNKKGLKKGPKLVVKPGKKLKLPKSKLLTKNKLKKDDGSNSCKDDENSIRRSNRIKTISSQKKTSKGKGLVKKDNKEVDSDTSTSGNTDDKCPSRESPQFVVPNNNGESEHKPVKVKSRWRRSSELEMNTAQAKVSMLTTTSASVVTVPALPTGAKAPKMDEEVERRLKQFVHLKENQYLTERISCKEAKKMTCDCFLTDDEMKHGEFGCGEDCLNRLLMIECGNLCTVGDRCTNKRFQKTQFAPCEAFRTDKKGLGIRASANIPYGEFILEYVGEVLDPDEFDARATEYSKDKNQHYYFMSLRADAVIDATQKGNISRFINHSCDPNAETQKWTVNGELRIGFFSKRTILAGEEITFDYQFQRYGKEAQKCYCEALTCRGWLGEEPEEEEEEEEEEDEEEEEEEEPEVVKIEEIKDATAVIEEVRDLHTEEVKVEGELAEKPEVVVKEKSPKKEKKLKILRPKRIRMDIFEDLDLDDEIETLQTTGLKNQAHTLKLSRLMVRAKETAQRTRLLKLLKRGELPCRRLFLDYHGLRLIHGWMTDAQHLVKTDNKIEFLRLEILQTLMMLPIPNKTMLQDSKVLLTVEKWAESEKPVASPTESETNSPKSEADCPTFETKEEPPPPEPKIAEPVPEPKTEAAAVDDEFEIRRSVGMDVTRKPAYRPFRGKNIAEEFANIFDDDMDISPIAFDEMEPNAEIKDVMTAVVAPKQDEYDVVVEILALAAKLLEEWAGLKEVFRIPKKERIEQMKEHEREADRRFKALSLEQENLERKRENRYRMHRSRSSDLSDMRSRKHMKCDDRNYIHMPQISKHERRKMFAMQVEQAEIDRRRKQQEMWQQHVKNCMMMGTDPRFTAPFDPNRGYHCIWNPQIGQWQNYPLPDQSMMFNQGVPHMPAANFPYIPPPNMHPHSLAAPQHPLHMPQNPHIPPNLHNLPPHNLPVSQSPHMVHNLHPPHVQVPPSPHPSHNLHNIPVPPSPRPTHNLHLQVSQSPHPLHHAHSLPSPQTPHHPLNVTNPLHPIGVPPPQTAHHTHNVPPPSHLHPPPVLPQSTSVPPPIIHQTNVPISSSMPQGMVPSNVGQPNIQPANMGTLPPMPNIPPRPSLPFKDDVDDPSRVMFAGPIPPPVKLPPKWKCAKDKYGRPYYYHVKIRKSQWEPPEPPPDPFLDEEAYMSETSSSSDTSSLSSDSSSEDSDSDDIDDSTLMLEIRNKFKRMEAQKKLEAAKTAEGARPAEPEALPVIKEDPNVTDDVKSPHDFLQEDSLDRDMGTTEPEDAVISSLDKRLIEELGLLKASEPPQKKRRVGLVQEIIISPRTEEGRLQFKEDVKKYKQNKEKLRKQREAIAAQAKKPAKPVPSTADSPEMSPVAAGSGSGKSAKSQRKKIVIRTKLKELETNSDLGKKIKEAFRSTMASVMVSILNVYRKPECTEGRITNTEDFKHLARKLTHFVMLKELKHCQKIEELTCTDSVKTKAREFVRKYMAKFGETYQRPSDDLDNY